jgi:PAS domain S-box-containing protein
MIADVINHPEAEKYLKRFPPGVFIFRENDASQDLYILVSGELEVLKGSRVISGIDAAGTFFGEMSFLLGGRRTASVKTAQETEVIRVPRDDITAFMRKFPAAVLDITRIMARRLDETTRVSYGLSEFCDRLPDAVLLTDEEGRLLTWNRAAETLYGIDSLPTSGRCVDQIYQDPHAYRRFIEGASSQNPVREKTLAVRRPDGRTTRFVSTSLTLLYDGHHNFQGVLSIGRDVTAYRRMERKYRFARTWLFPCLALVALLASAIFYGYPHYLRGQHADREDSSGLQTLLGKDYFLLKSLLTGRIGAQNRPPMARLLGEFLALQQKSSPPYNGLLLLDENKKVIDAVSLESGDTRPELIGASYGGVDFKGPADSRHRVLELYRPDSENPMGAKCLELAFPLAAADGSAGWIVFQLNAQELIEKYGVTSENLQKMVFESP